MRIAALSKKWPREREPFPVEALRAWVGRPPNVPEFLRIRNRALVSLGLRAMLRAAELVKIGLEDVHESGGGLAVRLCPSKADQNAMRKPIFIDPTGSPTCPAALTRTLISMHRALAAGYSVDEVMALGAWKSEAVKQYLLPLVTRNRNVSKSFGL